MKLPKKNIGHEDIESAKHIHDDKGHASKQIHDEKTHGPRSHPSENAKKRGPRI